MKPSTDATTDRAHILLRVADYLGLPQKYLAVANARAEMRRTLELAAKGSVVLTSHGEPEAALVPFTVLEDLRRALLHLLVAEMETCFLRTQEHLRSQGEEIMESTDEEIDAFVAEAVRKTRRSRCKTIRKVSRG